MKKFLILAALTLFISGLTLLGFWGGRKFCMTMMWPGSVNPTQSWYFGLGLNDEQAQALQREETSFREGTDQLCIRICKMRLDLLGKMRDHRADPALVSKKIEEIGNLQILLEKEIAAHILKVKKSLTPEQSQAYLDRIHQELRESIQRSGYGEALS